MNSNINSFEFSPQLYVRAVGASHLILLLAGVFAVIFVSDRLIVSGDVTGTANSLVVAQSLWRYGNPADLVKQVLDGLLCGSFI